MWKPSPLSASAASVRLVVVGHSPFSTDTDTKPAGGRGSPVMGVDGRTDIEELVDGCEVWGARGELDVSVFGAVVEQLATGTLGIVRHRDGQGQAGGRH